MTRTVHRCFCFIYLLAFAFAPVTAARAQTAEMDFSTWLASAEARLGSNAGTLTLDRPAHLDRPVALGANHNLVIDAPLRLQKGANIRLLSYNSVHCNAPLVTESPLTIFSADGATGISVSGCRATANVAGGLLLSASRSSAVFMTSNMVTEMGLFTTANAGGPADQTTDVTITGNSSTFAKGGGEMGVYLLYVQHAVVANNRFTGNGHGVEWWGGNANGGWSGPQSVVNAGDLSISGNVCENIGGACVWGSMGRNISVTGNTANGCGDVCFDVEGGTDTVFSGNSARGCNFGCYAVEFESAGVVFSSNFAYSEGGHAMVLVKHGPGNPFSHTDLSVTGNTFRCRFICPAIYTEGEDGLIFTHNTLTNAVIVTVNYHNDVQISGNTFHITADLSDAVIAAPALFHGRHSEISDNYLLYEGPSARPNGCIAQGYSDSNDTDEMAILRNTCIGFTTGIYTISSGPNPGAPHAVWLVSGNHVSAAKPYVHVHSSGNEAYTFLPDNTELQGSNFVLSKQ